MSKTARAVKKAAKKAEQIHAEVYGTEGEGVSDPDALLDGVIDNSDAPSEPPVEPILAVVPDIEPPVEPEALVEPVDPTDTELLEKAEHKYSVLQGMHRKMLDENNELRGRLDVLEAAPVAPIEASPVATVNGTDIDDYGSDLVDMVKRTAQAEISPQLAHLEEENARLKQQITGVTSTINSKAKGDIYSILADQVPDWEQINNSDEFLFWLAQQDPFSGSRRHDLLTQAFKTNDAARVLTFFNAFLNENMMVAPPTPAAETPAPVTPKVDLISMAAPGRAQASGKPSNQTDTRIYTRAEIAQHYKTVQLGKFGGSEAEKTRIEKAFVLAANQGRVT